MRKFSSSKRAKIMAIAAAGLVLGVGGTVTLAAWVDNEWVYGGTGGDEPGVGTSEFIVEQNRTVPFANDLGSWEDFPDNPGGSLTFGGDAPLALTPGDTIYAPVALRTTVDSIAGTTVAQEAVAAAGVTVDDPGDLLWDSLYLRVGVQTVAAAGPAPTCNESMTGYTIIADGYGLDTAFTDDTEPITAAGASYLHYCFEISLETAENLEEEFDGLDVNDLQGRTVAPAWEFISTSN